MIVRDISKIMTYELISLHLLWYQGVLRTRSRANGDSIEEHEKSKPKRYVIVWMIHNIHNDYTKIGKNI